MARNSLPQNLIITPGSTLKKFDTIGDWTASGGGATIEADSSIYGTQCLKFNAPTGGIASSFDCVISNSFPENEGNDFLLRFACHCPKADVSSFRVYLGNSAMSKYYTWNCGSNWFGDGLDMLYPLPRYAVDAPTGGARWDDTFLKLRIRFTPASGKTASMTFKDIIMGQRSIPVTIIRFDDGRKSIIDIAFPYMEARGIKGTLYINPSRVGTTGYMTLDDLRILKNAGWAICNHSWNHPHLESLTYAELINEFQSTIDYIIDNDLNVDDSAYHVAYPYGDVYNATIEMAMNQLGIKTAMRATWLYQMPNTEFLLRLHNNGINSSLSLDSVKSIVSKNQKIGGIGIYLLHNIVPTIGDAVYDVLDTVFYGFIDFLVSENIKVQTITQLQKGLSNPRLLY